jgi:hypothetical protein
LQDFNESRRRIWTRWNQLQTERTSWIDQWREISRFLLPSTGRFLTTDRNLGVKRNGNIYDEEATYALGVLAAGMMAGMTSPARPWFRLATPDKDLNETQSVKIWLEQVGEIMLDVFSRSNTYRALHAGYEELGAYGTSANIIVPNFERVLHNYPLTAGQYAIATNDFDEVDTLFREFDMTIAQIVGRFVKQPGGAMNWSTVSPTIKNIWDRGNGIDSWVTVLHCIQPRDEYDSSKADNKNMPFASIYMEKGYNNGERFLGESGYKRFPCLAPRWKTSGGDIYGRGPGIETLGSIKQLQHQQLRKAQAIDYQVKPPLQVPTSFKNQDINTLPGGVSFVDSTSAQSGIRSAWEVNLNLGDLKIDIDDVRRRIGRNFYVDLFLMLANDDRSGITAREIAERHEEKMLMLGPVLERLQDELLKPLVDIAFDRLIEANVLPPPPQELHGVELNIEFVSVLAQAQRAVGTSSIDRLLGTIGSMAQFKPEVLDKIDADAIVDKYSDQLGVDPKLIVANDKVAIIRQQRAQAAAKQQQAEQIMQASQAAKNLGQAPTTGGNALSDLTNQFSGYTIPQGAG